MKKVAFLAIVAVFGLMASAQAQTNAGHMLLDSPYHVEGTQNAGEQIVCSLVLPSTIEFGMDKIMGLSPVEFIVNDLFPPFTVYHLDENCVQLGTWATAFAGATWTGMTVDEPTQSVYWAVDLGGGTIDDFTLYTGAAVVATPPLGVPVGWTISGPIALDTNVPGKLAYLQDIGLDTFQEVDLASGAFGCTFKNPDDAGSGAYGNGCSEAADPSACGGATMLPSSGTITEGQVTRASQVDCTVSVCYTTWDIGLATNPSGEFFVNGIEEFFETVSGSGNKDLMAMGNVTGIVFHLTQVVGVADCQGVDSPDSDVLYVNALQGGSSRKVGINNIYPIALAIQKPGPYPGAGPGKFINTLNLGEPDGTTITPLPAGLGSFCFALLIPPFGTASPLCVWNNIGKTDRVGATNYFGTNMTNPPKAPTFMNASMPGNPLIAGGDHSNWQLGSQYTYQGVVLSPTASSPKGASVTNAIIVDVTAGQ